MFVIPVDNRRDAGGAPRRYMIFQSFVVENGQSIQLAPVHYPMALLEEGGGGHLRADGIEAPSFEVNIRRISSRHPTKPSFYTSHATKTREYIWMPNRQQSLPVFKMTDPTKILPSSYCHVGRGEDHEKKIHFTGEDLIQRSLEGPPPARQQGVAIPRHVFQVFVETAVQKREACPITLETLTKETAASPPCGHLFQKEALQEALEKNGRCPLCRKEAKKEEIQVY